MPKGQGFDFIRFSHSLQNSDLDESSGLALSQDGRLWSHNDSQGSASLFTFDSSGKFLKEHTLKGVENVDWEDLSIIRNGTKEHILVSDIGNNWHRRKVSPLYLLATNSQAQAEVLRQFLVSFPEQETINCESVAYDESSDTLFLLEKNYDDSAKLFYIPQFISGADKREAQVLTSLSLKIATSMDIQGNKAAILTPKVIYLFEKLSSETWAEAFKKRPQKLNLPELLPQTEGLCFSQEGKSLLISTETKGHGLELTPIYEISLEVK